MVFIPFASVLFRFIPLYSVIAMTDNFSLPGIKALAYVNALELPSDLGLVGISGTPLSLMVASVAIPFTGEATCTCTRSNANGAGNATVELVFQSLLALPEHMPLAFLVTDANDRCFLIGVQEQPWPYVESSQGLGLPDGESSTTTYTVTYKAPKALIPCTCAL